MDQSLGLFVVADGMGGHSGGEVASAMAIQVTSQIVAEADESQTPREVLIQAYRTSSAAIFDRAKYEDPELTGMGTTMVAIYAPGETAYIGNVGDSRVYLFRENHLWQLTEDHSLINEQLRSGVISEADLPHLNIRNVITRSVGYEYEVRVDVLERDLQVGDCFLLCSDGLSSLVDHQDIEEMLKNHPPEKVPDVCVEKALENGGDDNVTVMYVCCLPSN